MRLLSFLLLRSVRQWLDRVEIRNRLVARFLCKLIPAQCPFQRDIKLLGCPVLHIPPLCQAEFALPGTDCPSIHAPSAISLISAARTPKIFPESEIAGLMILFHRSSGRRPSHFRFFI
ncbi:MAG: Mo-dependent nitrogenase C-terminal domain-containing protein [Oscillatoria sp. Prado101]|nr:Mo-dependent nitrogenase C-terminal domain-containing protein [Oscillatoria sp. Prado101]